MLRYICRLVAIGALRRKPWEDRRAVVIKLLRKARRGG
jgi:hypothetical protein